MLVKVSMALTSIQNRALTTLFGFDHEKQNDKKRIRSRQRNFGGNDGMRCCYASGWWNDETGICHSGGRHE